MKTYRKIVETTIIDENNHEEKHLTETLHKVRTWQELTREEQEKEIENNKEGIYELYQNDLYENYKCELDNLRYDFKNIQFEDIYCDSNSQGWWIDSINKPYFHFETSIYGITLNVYDIDISIRKYIQEINENDIDIEYLNYGNSFITIEEEQRIKNTKKYKDFIKGIVDYVNKWINQVNNICEEMCSKEYYYPYNLDDSEDKDYLDFYFENRDFEEEEIIKSEDC